MTSFSFSIQPELVAIVLVLLVSVSSDLVASVDSSAEFYTFEVVNEYEHDHRAFTQGLLCAGNDTLFESTGLYKESSVRKVHLETGKVLNFHKMDDSFFGEGLTLLGGRLFQVTWLKTTGFIYDLRTLNQIGSFNHHMEDGWGLATDGKILFGTDGTSSLYEINPENFKVLNRVTVRYEDREVFNLNELEFINGEVWANVWQTDCIARISPGDGKVMSWILLHQLREHLISLGYYGIDVLNGIAWDEENKRLFVTGKLWPKLYEIKLHPIPGRFQGDITQLCRLSS